MNFLKSKSIFFFLLSAGLLLALTPIAQSEELTSETCMACHEEEKPLVNFKTFSASVHGSIGCADCHSDIKETPHPEKLKKVDCTSCHETESAEYQKSIHHELTAAGVKGPASCTSCHGTHEILPKDHPQSLSNRLNIDQTCLKCHGSTAFTESHPNMANPKVVLDYEKSVHAKAMKEKGLNISATCTDCHGFHHVRPPSDDASPVNLKNVPNTCGKCHQGIFTQFQESSHGKGWQAKNSETPVCTTCHESHGIRSSASRKFRSEIASNCAGCHIEQAETYHDTFHGKSSSLGYAQAATCSDCHTPHHNLPASDPRSSIHRSKLVNTCGKCHSQSNENFARYKPHLNPEDKDQAGFIYYIYHFMSILLLGVFTFWGIHTLLWLQRAVVAVIRGEIKHPASSGQYIRRFSSTTIRLHIIIVISFLGLVATGLPLKYHDSAWAAWLVRIHGGVEITRFIHRTLAVVTFGYCVFHLAHLAYLILLKKKRNVLWGPDSLTPRIKDFQDLWANLKWFFYAGKVPAFDRWTYFEKFDYFAVFWGIPVIGFSGLMLWFPSFFMKFLPGEALNIAAIIHSEEALLAAAFIFTVHFFHNHLRPENFPMDISIFTGSISLERFKAERPEEYQRLLAENKLQERLVPAPSPELQRRCRIFGTYAVAVGTALIIGILITLF